MNRYELIRKLRDFEAEVSNIRYALEQDDSWNVTRHYGEEDLESNAAFVEQIELLLEKGAYIVQLRFDDDTTESLGTFQLHSTAYDCARDQARRYKISVFDSTYEQLVD